MDRNQKVTQGPAEQKQRIVVETKATPLSRLGAILLVPTIVVAAVVGIFTEGHNTHPFSLDHVLGFAFIAAPFAFFVAYKLFKGFGTKVILTDHKVIDITSAGHERQFYWGEIKKISITRNPDTNDFHFVFSKKKRSVPFDKDNRIFCPPAILFGKPNMSADATSLILNKIDVYKIPVQGEKGVLEELFNKSGPFRQKQAEHPKPSQQTGTRIRINPSPSQTSPPKIPNR